VEWKDGSWAEAFAWSHCVGYRWVDDGATERLIVIFGEPAAWRYAVELPLANLARHHADVMAVDKRTRLWEGNATVAFEPRNEPIMLGAKLYPDCVEILMGIKREHNVQTRYTRRIIWDFRSKNTAVASSQLFWHLQ
jgi:hypothetical protein